MGNDITKIPGQSWAGDVAVRGWCLNTTIIILLTPQAPGLPSSLDHISSCHQYLQQHAHTNTAFYIFISRVLSAKIYVNVNIPYAPAFLDCDPKSDCAGAVLVRLTVQPPPSLPSVSLSCLSNLSETLLYIQLCHFILHPPSFPCHPVRGSQVSWWLISTHNLIFLVFFSLEFHGLWCIGRNIAPTPPQSIFFQYSVPFQLYVSWPFSLFLLLAWMSHVF